jgi:hypothetical protein
MSKLPYVNQVIKDEHIIEANAKRVGLYVWDVENLTWVRATGDSNGFLQTPQYDTRREKTAEGIIYYGEATAGSLESQSIWRIYRVKDVDGVEVKEYADGDINFDNSWSSRADIPYGAEGGTGIGYWAIGSTFVVA